MAGNKADWIKRNPDRQREYRRKYAAQLKVKRPHEWERRKRNDQLRKYGLTVKDYERMHIRQSGLCAVCQRPESIRKHLSVDHNHETGQIRELLCARCNAAIGQLCEDPLRALAAAAYLTKWERDVREQ